MPMRFETKPSSRYCAKTREQAAGQERARIGVDEDIDCPHRVVARAVVVQALWQ